jgi:hypothetical protein
MMLTPSPQAPLLRISKNGKVNTWLYPHQSAFVQAPWVRRDLEYFFMVAGYGSGKSFTIVGMMLYIAMMYMGRSIVVGIGGDTITRLRKTVVLDLERVCEMWGTSYEDDRGQNIITLGSTKFHLVNTSQPAEIYGTSYSIFLCDELDELKQDVAMMAFTAIQERTRVRLPDGRLPFSAFFTTAQGYRGTYQIISNLKEAGERYFHMRAATRMNKALPASYERRLRAQYTDIEVLVYLEGYFANITTGRVYYEYDESKHMLATRPFEVGEHEDVHVGQDLNAGFSRGTAFVKRKVNIGGKEVPTLYIVKTWSFPEIGDAPRIMRNDFPTQEIYWYPDASGKEVIAGYRAEMRAANIHLRIGTINPDVVDRIYVINKLFRSNRCILFPECGPLSMALKVRQFDDHGNPYKGKGPEAPDHYCDGCEYAAWRIVRSDLDFYDIYATTKTYRKHPERAVA